MHGEKGKKGENVRKETSRAGPKRSSLTRAGTSSIDSHLFFRGKQTLKEED